MPLLLRSKSLSSVAKKEECKSPEKYRSIEQFYASNKQALDSVIDRRVSKERADTQQTAKQQKKKIIVKTNLLTQRRDWRSQRADHIQTRIQERRELSLHQKFGLEKAQKRVDQYINEKVYS